MSMRTLKKQGSPKTASKLRNFIGFVRFFIALTLVLLIGGFVIFTYSVNAARPDTSIPSADGIVILTGDAGRMSAGGQLFSQNKAERMLITGVAPQVSQADLQQLLNLPEATLSCCIDIDVNAKDTLGNARETATWVAALGYEHIILVTSDYHMPRAKLELTTSTKGIRITPYPVRAAEQGPIWRNKRQLDLLWREYAKLLVIYMRDSGARPEQPPQPVPAPTDVMRDAQDPPKITGPEKPKSQPPKAVKSDELP